MKFKVKSRSPYRLHNIEDFNLREHTRVKLENARSRGDTYYKVNGIFIASFETPMEAWNIRIGCMGLEEALKKFQQIVNSPNFQAKFDRFYNPKNYCPNADGSPHIPDPVYNATLNFHYPERMGGESEELIWFSPALYEKDKLKKIMESHQDLLQQLKELALTPEELYQFINE